MEDDIVWILMPASQVPERWVERSRSMMLVPLLASEASGILHKGAAIPGLTQEDERIAHLAAEGLRAEEIAAELHMTARSVYRRLARLRKLVGATTGAELISKLAARGF